MHQFKVGCVGVGRRRGGYRSVCVGGDALKNPSEIVGGGGS